MLKQCLTAIVITLGVSHCVKAESYWSGDTTHARCPTACDGNSNLHNVATQFNCCSKATMPSAGIKVT